MLNLALSFAAGVAVTLLIRLMGFGFVAGIIPGTIVFLGVLVLMGRRTFQKLQKIMTEVQGELQSLTPNPREQKVKVEKAVKLLESALPLGQWQLMIEGEVYGQIGVIKYMFKDHEGAEAAFKKSGSRNYLAKAMNACLYYQRKEYPAMEAAFEEAVKAGKKEGVVWAAYAWCLNQIKEGEKALRVLSRAVEANPSDEKLKNAMSALQNDKKLKMRPWEPMWWQFGLEAPPAQQPMMVGHRGARPRMQRR